MYRVGLKQAYSKYILYTVYLLLDHLVCSVCMTETRNAYKISVGNFKGKGRHRVIRKRTVNSNHVAQNKDTVLRVVQSAKTLTDLFSNSFSPWGEFQVFRRYRTGSQHRNCSNTKQLLICMTTYHDYPPITERMCKRRTETLKIHGTNQINVHS